MSRGVGGRRDKYQSNVKEYYIETGTEVDYEEGWDESMSQTFTAEPDTVHGVMLGVDGPGPSMGFSDGEGMGKVADGKDESQSGEERMSASDDDDDDSEAHESRLVAGRKANKKSGEQAREEPDDEETFACCSSVWIFKLSIGIATENIIKSKRSFTMFLRGHHSGRRDPAANSEDGCQAVSRC